MVKKNIFLLASLLLVMSLSVWACGDNDDDAESSDDQVASMLYVFQGDAKIAGDTLQIENQYVE